MVIIRDAGVPLRYPFARAACFGAFASFCGGANGDWHTPCVAMASFARTVCVLLTVLLCACATIPQAELTSYRAAFDEARSAGESLILDFDAARAENNRRLEAMTPPPEEPPPVIPNTYTPPQLEISTITDTKVRLLLWQAIHDYNLALAALASGESAEEVQATAGQLAGVVSRLAEAGGRVIPGAGALTALAQEIAGQLENARTAEEFRTAVQGGTPIVRKLLENCLTDARTHYGVRARLAELDYRRVEFETNLDDTAKNLKRARIKATMDEFRLTIDNYFRLINQMDRSLVTLQTAVDRPRDFEAEATRIVDVVLDLKQHWAAYQDARNAAAIN